MYSNIIPVLRSIRGIESFTYHVPSTLTVQPGSLVQIPWRSDIVLGVVEQIDLPKPRFVVKAIIAVLPVVLPKKYIDYIEWFHEFYAISLPHAWKLALPTWPKRSFLQKPTLPPSTNRPTGSTPTLHIINSTRQLHEKLKLLCSQYAKIAIIVPEEILIKQLPLTPQYVITGATANGQMFKAWLAMLQVETGIWLGTKRLALFPLTECDAVIVLYPENPAHKQWDQNPRYHVNRLIDWLARTTSVKCHALSEAPRVDETIQWTVQTDTTAGRTSQTHIVDISNQPINRQAIISTPLLDRCDQGYNIFFFLNKLGDGTGWFCTSCENSVAGDIATICPYCQGATLRKIGFGTRTVAEELKKHFPSRSVLELTKTTTTSFDAAADFVVGTSYALNQINWSEMKAAVIVDHDWLLTIPSFRATESAWRIITWLRNRVDQLYIQTRLPDHPIFQALNQVYPKQWYEELAQQRQTTLLPPFAERISIRQRSQKIERFVTTLPKKLSPTELIDREI